MKWVEHVVLGAVGGAVGTMGSALIAVEGNLLERLGTGLSSYATLPALVLSSVLLGWIGGRIIQSDTGAFLGGVAGPLVFFAIQLIF